MLESNTIVQIETISLDIEVVSEVIRSLYMRGENIPVKAVISRPHGKMALLNINR